MTANKVKEFFRGRLTNEDESFLNLWLDDKKKAFLIFNNNKFDIDKGWFANSYTVWDNYRIRYISVNCVK